MKKLIVISIVALFFSGCASDRALLPHIPKDVEVTGLEVSVNSPWGGTTTIKVESYKGTGTTE